MSISQAFDLTDVDNFVAPLHLGEAYQNQEIPSFEDLAILSAQYYMRESDHALSELNAAKKSLTEAVQKATSAEAKLVRYENLNASLETKDNQILELKAKLVKYEPLATINANLAADNERLLLEQEQNANALKNAELQASELVELKSTNEYNQTILKANEELIKKLEQDVSVLQIDLTSSQSREANLTKELNALNAKNQQLLEDIKKANEAKRFEQEKNEELSKLSKQSADDIDEAKKACNIVSKTLVDLNKTNQDLDRENRLLSVYVNSQSTAPMMETPDGHTLRALMLDKDRICSADGKEIIEDNTAIFLWTNPNGFSCIVALSNNPNEERLLLMPSLCDPNLMAEGSPEHVISTDITNRITPPKEYREDIAKHIRAFDVADFKQTMLKAFSRANHIAKHTEDLDSKLKDIYANGTPAEMEALLSQCSDALGTTSKKIKDARRPRKAPASKSKRRKSKR